MQQKQQEELDIKSLMYKLSNFERKNNVISKEKVNSMKFIQFTAGLDIAYS